MLARRYTKREVSKAPINARPIYDSFDWILKNEIPNTINRDAPVLTPSILGSAIGFLVIDCINTPEILREAPAIMPKTVLGRRASTTFTL